MSLLRSSSSTCSPIARARRPCAPTAPPLVRVVRLRPARGAPPDRAPAHPVCRRNLRRDPAHAPEDRRPGPDQRASVAMASACPYQAEYHLAYLYCAAPPAERSTIVATTRTRGPAPHVPNPPQPATWRRHAPTAPASSALTVRPMATPTRCEKSQLGPFQPKGSATKRWEDCGKPFCAKASQRPEAEILYPALPYPSATPSAGRHATVWRRPRSRKSSPFPMRWSDRSAAARIGRSCRSRARSPRRARPGKPAPECPRSMC
jgi:hypothetical protein